MTNDTNDGNPVHACARTRTRSKYTHIRAHTPELKRRHCRHLEAEYGEPIPAIIAGYYADGESQRSVSRILRIPRHHIRAYSAHYGLTPPDVPVTVRTRSALHRAHIRATMRRKHGRRLKYRGRCRSVAEWAELTGLPAATIRKRLARGWTVHRALTHGAHHA